MTKKDIAVEMEDIRNSWSEGERQQRQQLAGAMQLQLRQLVVLASLSQSQPRSDSRSQQMANAC